MQSGPRSKPRKRQAAPAAGHGRQPFTEGDISLNSLTEAPVVFPAFAVGETPAPERSEGERGGGRTSPMSKALRKQGAEV